MKLSVYVLGRDVAVLEQQGDFKTVLTYQAGTAENDLVSLTMPVRTESYVRDDQLPPVLQMNLPEGYLLQVLQEQFGPHVGESPIALLSVIGRNRVGRLRVAAGGADLGEPAQAFEVATLLKGDNSEAAFARLVRQHATTPPAVSRVWCRRFWMRSRPHRPGWQRTEGRASSPTGTSSRARAISRPSSR